MSITLKGLMKRHAYLMLCSLMLLVSSAVIVTPMAAQNGDVWTAEYYNNRYLTGAPVLSRQDGRIAFNWGASAPYSEVNADNFSVRWASDPYFEAGTYRFYVLADDNVSLRVDYPFAPQIDTFTNPQVGQIISVDITLEAGVHHIQLDYREVTGNAYVYLTWANVASNPTGPDFSVPQMPVTVGGAWTGQYFANINLIGSPSLILSETTPSHNWGAASPAVNIPADNFSARWTSVQTLNAGSYQFSVRVDDGVRVYVDGLPIIDEWHGAADTTYTQTVNLSAGQHNIQVDYYEAAGIAFIDFNLMPLNTNLPPVIPAPSSSVGTVVTALRLNVRSQPATAGNILVKINRNENYPVIGRNLDSSWWQINVNGTVGWVYWRFFDVLNPQLVPVVTNTTGASLNQPPATGYVATTLATVNVRSEPASSGAILGQVARGNQIPVVGRNAANTWWQVNYGEITGWVSAVFAPLQSNAVLATIPVTG